MPAKKLYVTYNGRAFKQWVAARNFEDVIRAVISDHGVATVMALPLVLEGHKLIQIGGSTARRAKDCGAYFLATHSDVDGKAEVLRQLKRALNLDMEISVLSPAEVAAQADAQLLS